MKQVMFLAVFTMMGFVANAQSWQWGRRGGGSAGLNNSAEKILDMVTDAKGNIYMLAQLDGGGDESVSNGNGDSTVLNTWGGRDAALISYNCNGKLRWVKVFGNAYEDKAIGMGMDSLGHINVTMSTDDNFNIDIDSFATNPKRKKIGIIQYDTAGHFKWFRQPSPDSVSVLKNLGQYGVFGISTTSDGDSYVLCALGTGLIAGSTNLVATTPGLYMIKYNVNGIPKELIKMDMRVANVYWNYMNFSVTKSRKFIFTAIKGTSKTDSLIVGGQQVKHPLFLCCFNSTGNLLWRTENTDTTSGSINGRPVLDETNGLVYVCGGGIWGTQRVDTIGGIPIINLGNKGFLPFWACLDTLGNFKRVNWGSCNVNTNCSLNNLTFRSDGRLFADGNGGGVIWGAYYFSGGTGTGLQTFMPSFEATTGVVMSMDSLRGSSVNYGDIITADNNNNIYVGGRLSSDIKVGSQTLQSAGGLSDFFVAKYGFANCATVPVKLTDYHLQVAENGIRNVKQITNLWTTATEVNTSYFNIQRSNSGSSFETIGKVSAKGASNYSFTDLLPVNYAFKTTIYYRLEVVDKDGSKEYSEIKSVEVKVKDGEISVYPNPTTNFIYVLGTNFKEIQILDYLGKVIIDKKINNQQVNLINIQTISKGLYLIKAITNNNTVITQKLIKE